MSESTKALDDWDYVVVPGWPTQNFINQGRLERAGNVLLPQSFTLIASNDGKRESVFLCFVVQDGEVKMSAVMSSHSDVHTGLDALRAAAPMEQWKRLAIITMTHWLATTDPDVAALGPQYTAANKAASDDWVEALRAWQAAFPHLDTEEAVKAAGSVPLDPAKRRRNRITREHLERVAEVYRNADAAGAPPTRTVQEQFGTTHSTAAKWVSQARKQGILGPPPGTRGGEVGSPAAAAATQRLAEAAARPLTNRIRKAVADSLEQGQAGEDEE
ncbi:hypothetical protein [Streptomyces sp. ECR3.8]|uniref:hypothetical protein n=1 Tax=Streptomyces sp. ECR3.8 TaxID=3461009 RepID=UPI0040427FE4